VRPVSRRGSEHRGAARGGSQARPPEERSEPGRVVDVRLTAWVHGHVQGVGFRWWVRARALELGLVGWATNLDDGRVEVVAEGPPSAVQALLDALNGPGAPGRVRTVVERWAQASGGITGFAER
jgi:acylphosphatase